MCDCRYVCFIVVVGSCWLIFRKHGKVNQSFNLVLCSVFRNLLILLFSGCLNGKRIQNKTQTVRSFSGVMADKCREENMNKTSLPVGKELSVANPNDKKR